jgi:serine/threonine protein kinase
VLKVFDFGLAKELMEEERREDGLYLMTGFSGAIRYMAPEVGLRKPYNLSADVYSWSMIMWYIMALEPPMVLYTPSMFIDRVFQRGYRPLVKAKWSARLGDVMRAAWSDDISERPSFKTIMRAIQDEAATLDPELGDCFGNESVSTRSSSRIHI